MRRWTAVLVRIREKSHTRIRQSLCAELVSILRISQVVLEFYEGVVR
jgi:hypothetical protein